MDWHYKNVVNDIITKSLHKQDTEINNIKY